MQFRNGWLGAAAAFSVAVLAALPARAEQKVTVPGWGLGQLTLPVPVEHCVGRARLAMKALGYEIGSVWQGMTVASNAKLGVVIACVAAADSTTVVNFVRFANANITAPEAKAIEDEMLKPNCRPTPWGFQFCDVGS
jgi:hypothetical protein